MYESLYYSYKKVFIIGNLMIDNHDLKTDKKLTNVIVQLHMFYTKTGIVDLLIFLVSINSRIIQYTACRHNT